MCIYWAQGYLARKIFKCVFYLSFHNYKIVFKVRISYPLQIKLVDGSNRKETRPRRPRIQFEKLYFQVVLCKMSLCHILNLRPFLGFIFKNKSVIIWNMGCLKKEDICNRNQMILILNSSSIILNMLQVFMENMDVNDSRSNMEEG